MPLAVGTQVAKDGNSALVAGGIRAFDLSAAGDGSGPWTLGQVLIDGVAGVNRATIKSASTAAQAADTAIVVAISPNGQNANGQAPMVDSAPVVPASDWVLPGSGVAHDAADSGNPHKIGAKAVAGLNGQTLVAANDRANLFAGLDGALIVRPMCGLEDIVSGNASNTDGASTEVIAAAGAGIKQYLTRVILTNMHATSTIYVEMKSGTTVKATLPCPPGGAMIHFDPPLPPNAANEAWNFDPSAATTTIYCSAVGFKSKV